MRERKKREGDRRKEEKKKRGGASSICQHSEAAAPSRKDSNSSRLRKACGALEKVAPWVSTPLDLQDEGPLPSCEISSLWQPGRFHLGWEGGGGQEAWEG